jgi:hypothetical protein
MRLLLEPERLGNSFAPSSLLTGAVRWARNRYTNLSL